MSISDIMMRYEYIRARNEDEAERRRQEVYQKVPQIESIHRQKRDLQLAALRSAIDGSEQDPSQVLALTEQANALLIGAGFPADYMEPIYTCAHCKDTGFKEDTSRCDCYKRFLLEDKLAAAKLTDSGVSFAQFDISIFGSEPLEGGKTQQDYMRAIKKHCERYAADFPYCESFLILSGATGLGKTYIAKCIQRAVIERGHTAAFYTAYRLFSMFHQHRLGERIDLAPVFKVPLLIIDDIGTEPMTRNVTVEYFFDLINERTDAGLHTVIATNLRFDEIKGRYGERIHSRLMDKYASKKIIFKGSDIRY